MMKSISIISTAVLVFVVSAAYGGSTMNNIMRPSQWMSSKQMEQIPSLDQISIEILENMPAEKGAQIMEHIYHLSQINHNLRPSFVPSSSNIPCHIYKNNGEKSTTTLDKLATMSKQQPQFGQEEVTIYITGSPALAESVKKANQELVEAYIQRYNNKRQNHQKQDRSNEKWQKTSSEEDSNESQKQERSSGNIVVIDLGSTMTNIKRMALLDTQKTGAMIADALIEIMQKTNTPDEIIHIVAQGIAAHAAGAAGNEYTRRTGRNLRRITALDPSKVYARDPETLTGLSRGDADFIDAIHTNAYGVGTIHRVGNVDFYPNGPSSAAPGTRNVIESSMRATRYYAESVRPGNERNFPAVAAHSMKEYLNNDGHGKRIHMGIDTDYDAEGDYMLEVNERSPFGKRTPARKQNNYHGMHKNQNQNDHE